MKTFRVAVIGRTGHGDYGHGVDTAWLTVPETQVVAVADDNPDGLAAAAGRLGVKEAFSDYRKMLDKTKPDIVAVGTRWIDQHHAMVMAAAERGMHVFMEKPFCPTLAEADEIVAACERTHAKLAIAHPTRYSPKIATVRKLIRDGKIGKVLEYRARGKEDHRGGGEDLWVLGSHMMDLMRAIGGHPQWCFAHVTQDGEPVTRRHVADGNEGIGPLAGDALHAIYGMPDGSTAYFSSVRNQAGNPRRYGLQIYGSRGVLEILEGNLPSVKYLADPSWSPGRSEAQWQDVSSAGIGKPEPLKGPLYEERHRLAINDLIAAINGQRDPACSVYDARGATEMIVAIFDSHRLKGPVPLPLKNRQNPLAML